jgi:hypothetical protein
MADAVDEPAPAPPPRKSVRTLAAGIAASYRNLDPIVAQVWAQPGTPPYAPTADAPTADEPTADAPDPEP